MKKKIKRKVFVSFVISLFLSILNTAQSSNSNMKSKFKLSTGDSLSFFETITKTPKTLKSVYKESFSKKAIPTWIGILASTLTLYYYDEQILSGVQRI